MTIRKNLFISLLLAFCFVLPGFSYALSKAEAQTTAASAKKVTHKEKHRVSHAVNAGKVNINKADANTLATLTAIGQKKAEDIVQYRTEHGKFKSIEDLTKVKGISDNILKKNQQRLVLS